MKLYCKVIPKLTLFQNILLGRNCEYKIFLFLIPIQSQKAGKVIMGLRLLLLWTTGFNFEWKRFRIRNLDVLSPWLSSVLMCSSPSPSITFSLLSVWNPNQVWATSSTAGSSSTTSTRAQGTKSWRNWGRPPPPSPTSNTDTGWSVGEHVTD